MRRLLFMVFAVLAAASVVSLSTLSAQAQSADQYGTSDGADAPQEPQNSPESTAPEETPPGASSSPEGSTSEGSVSQGSLDGAADSPEAVAARQDLAEEENLGDYSKVVDNTTKGAFRAPGWKVQRGSLSHGGSFVSAQRVKSPARFSFKVPSSNDYSVYAWWPATDGGTARYGVRSAEGMKWTEVEQGSDSGGMWVKVGTYAMKKGQGSVQLAGRSVGGGQVAADAVALVRGETAPPPEDQAVTASGQQRSTATTESRRIGSFTGRDVVRQARRHIGDRYRYGTCTQTRKSCTCLTKMAVQPFGHRMGMTESGQWRYADSSRVRKSRLRPGDEVFFKEGGSRYITHVGIYSGNGRIVHASAYWGKVVEKEMKYIDGYFGAKRFRSR